MSWHLQAWGSELKHTSVLCCRVALDAYAARDAAMQQALRESDERLKAMYTTM
jgi:hypothetical protein